MNLSLPIDLTIKEQHPDILIGLAELMTRVFRGEDLSELASYLLSKAQQDDGNALLDLSVLLQLQGNKSTGLAVQKEALSVQQLFTLNPLEAKGAKSRSNKVKLLAIYTCGDLMTNTPLEFLAQGADFTLHIQFIGANLPLPKALPEHDVAMVAISELDRNLSSLPIAEQLIAQLNTKVLNQPANIAKLSRDTISQELQNVAGVEIPLTIRATQQQLIEHTAKLTDAIGFQSISYPMIIRPIDSHAGNLLAKIDDIEQLNHYLNESNKPEYFIAAFVDYRSDDNLYRKYRIMVINGKPFIAHMAVSEHWMIHYLNAGMVENAHKRFAEAQAMGHFEQGFAKKHQQAFALLTEKIGLEYYGLDCAETIDGELLIFEACASLNVHSMDCEKTFPYKKVQMQKIYDAFHQMLIDNSK
jgi:glutathione synthase/RimK-type ligase-like ATP-grasp enzyme